MKIAAGVTVLGLGGLAGYALGSNDGQAASADAATAQESPKPKVHRQVVHRTIHVRPKGEPEDAAAGSAGGMSGSAPTPAVAPVSDTSASTGSRPAAPSTHTSGGGSSDSSSDGGDDGEEHEQESESSDD